MADVDGKIAGLILAGGKARRLGGVDKALQPLAGRPLLAWVLDRVRPQAGPLALSANGDAARFADTDLPVLPDTLPGQLGPLAGMLAGLEWAQARGADWLLVVPTDCPLLPTDLVLHLKSVIDHEPAAVASSGGQVHWSICLLRTSLADEMADWMNRGERRVESWMRHLGAALANFPQQKPDSFLNLNESRQFGDPDLLAALEKGRGGS